MSVIELEETSLSVCLTLLIEYETGKFVGRCLVLLLRTNIHLYFFKKRVKSFFGSSPKQMLLLSLEPLYWKTHRVDV